MSEPISLDVLVHSATHYQKNGEDSFGNPTWSTTPNSLSRIRVSVVKQTILTSLGEAKNDKLTLIYDCTNSLPKGVTFGERDKITYDGHDYIVREVIGPSGDASAPHHYRLALVGS